MNACSCYVCLLQSSSGQVTSQDEDSDVLGKSFDELLCSEVSRRRERDFGLSSATSSINSCLSGEEEDHEYEEDYIDCDSLCTESEVNSEVRNLDETPSNSDTDIPEAEHYAEQVHSKDSAGTHLYSTKLGHSVHMINMLFSQVLYASK